MSLTVAYHTGRTKPHFDWFFDSLRRQKGLKRVTQIIVVDFYAQLCDEWDGEDVYQRKQLLQRCAGDLWPLVSWYDPKPTIWQGPHRVTRENWWAMSSARNTSICLCRNDWLVLLDDRCVLHPEYLTAAKRSMSNNCITFGAYRKHHGLVVSDGRIVGEGTISGIDNREEYSKGQRCKVNGAWAYGCSLVAPVEWLLQVNGYPEQADGMSFEDVLLGRILENNGFPMFYDPKMRVSQDRTPSEMDKPFRREDKGVSPNDKSHASLIEIGGKKRSENEFDLREVRKQVLAGQPFPAPSNPNPVDWFDGQPIRGL